MQAAGEYVANGRKLAYGLGCACLPVAFAEVSVGPTAPFVKAGECLLGFRAVLCGDGEDSDLGEVGRDDFELAIFDLGDGEFHVALAAEYPDVADENVIEGECFVFAFDGDGLGFCVCFHCGEGDGP